MSPELPPGLEQLLPAAALERVSRALARSPVPARAARGLLRVLERAEVPVGLVGGLEDATLQRALALLGLEGAPLEALMADPQDLLALAWEQPPALDPESDLDDLRRIRRRFTLALAARELNGELEATEAARRLSDLADGLLDLTLQRLDQAPDSPGVAVLALGKLGGRELNYSSDVDLVLVRDDTTPARAAETLARRFVKEVQRSTAAGRMFRVDLRLRPYGSAGALVPRVTAMVEYYAKTGRTWERQALVKARVVAGSRAVGEELLDRIAPFVWRESLSARAIREIVGLRDQISSRSPDAERDVKAGPGGIRDVEFAVQFLQLLHGGQRPELRTSTTLGAVERLRRARILTEHEAAVLVGCYGFLRRLEHLLQLTLDREVTLLPQGEAATRLACCVGLGADALEESFHHTKNAARAVLDTLLRSAFRPQDAGSPALVDLLLTPQADPQDAVAELAALGFTRPEVAWRHLSAMVEEKNPLLSPSGRARTLLAGLAPRMLESVVTRPDPDRTLRNLERVTTPLGAKATVFQLLAADEDALGLLVDLAAGSDILVEVLASHPGVFDELIDRLLRHASFSRAEVENEVGAALAGPAGAAAVRELRALTLLLVAVPDLSGRSNLQNTARGLADAAEGFLRGFAMHATREVAAAHGGQPGDQLLALALGKLGGRDLSYASDLDLIFLHTGGDPAPDGTPAGTFWAEVVQRILALGESEASVEGPLLPIDLRLRPGGGKGPLCPSWEAVSTYYRGEGPGEEARDFERLAIQKARFVLGPPAVCQPLRAELDGILYEREPGPSLWDEVLTMRRRQVEATVRQDLKRGPGSVSDVELLVSALSLRYGGAQPALREPNTARLLDALEQSGIVTSSEYRNLRTAYSFLRRVVLRLRVRTWQVRPLLPEGVELRELAHALDYVDVGDAPAEEHFQQELSFHRQRILACFQAVIDRER